MSSLPFPSSASPSKSPQASQDDTHIAIIATVVVVVGLLAIGAATFFFLRWRSRRTGYDPEQRPRTSTAVDRSHVAARITPYGSTSNLVPRFNHTPGADMRIATRRPDGAWEFSFPGSSFTPSGVREIEPASSTSSVPSTPSSLEPPKSPAQLMKERESKAARLIRKGYDDREFDEESPPPPAYAHESAYLDHTK
ncbi:hypothetical protein AX15_006621 [Amanita polypyramis BW_CC]|nr:hypothetical protein AX15_006621 [Amanita polypyramis BW_CC]